MSQRKCFGGSFYRCNQILCLCEEGQSLPFVCEIRVSKVMLSPQKSWTVVIPKCLKTSLFCNLLFNFWKDTWSRTCNCFKIGNSRDFNACFLKSVLVWLMIIYQALTENCFSLLVFYLWLIDATAFKKTHKVTQVTKAGQWKGICSISEIIKWSSNFSVLCSETHLQLM